MIIRDDSSLYCKGLSQHASLEEVGSSSSDLPNFTCPMHKDKKVQQEAGGSQVSQPTDVLKFLYGCKIKMCASQLLDKHQDLPSP